MIKNSLKQLLRQPVKCLIFFLLLTAATALVIVGLVLSMESVQRIQAVEDAYTTIGSEASEMEFSEASAFFSVSKAPVTPFATVKLHLCGSILK